MRFRNIGLCLCLALGHFAGTTIGDEQHAVARQESSSGFPTLGSTSASQTQASSASKPVSSNSATTAASATSSPSGSQSQTTAVPSSSANNSTSIASSTISSAPTLTPAANSTATNTTATNSNGNELPLQPQITPALSIAGAILLMTGVVYAVIGVKNIWIHVFLSTAYLTSLSVLVLIVYVMSPPIKDTIQGAYFVGIFMTGVVFGGGALIFKEITEGLGCLLGGFCLAMWFLTLKAGGLITSTTGVGVFIAIFCFVCWCFSFSRHTRPYALIGATSFSGSTAFVLGIDCFSKAGLKEFWVYIWNLNDNLFPLGTETYPITRGIRVEIIVIVLGCIVGIISQIKLWKVVRNRQKQRAVAAEEDNRRRDAVEEALGRHLERQNDRDKSEWEKRYGDRLGAKRNTILWSDAHPEKRMSSYSVNEVDTSQGSSSEDSVEMSQLPNNLSRHSLHSAKGGKRQSHMSVQVIQEVEEDDQASFAKARPKSRAIEAARSGESPLSFGFAASSHSDLGEHHEYLSSSLKPHNSKPLANELASRLNIEGGEKNSKKRSSLQSLNDIKRRSWQSIRSLQSGEKSPRDLNIPNTPEFSESKEALVVTHESMGTPSRASSIAATLDEENEFIDAQELPPINMSREPRPPTIVVSPVHGVNFEDQLIDGLRAPPSPTALSEDFEADPEAIVRRPTAPSQKRPSSERLPADMEGSRPKSSDGNSQSSSGPVLTKDALENVPSQLSNVVLSYRTNEWAKHIATAEAPVFEEPEPVESHGDEAPVHLADPKSPAISSEDASQQIEKPPELPSPLVAAASSNHGIKVNPEAQPIASSPSLRASGEFTSEQQEVQAQNSSATSPALTNAPETTRNQNVRRASNPAPKAPLQNTIINENEVMNFPPTPNRVKRASTADRNSNVPNNSRPTTAVDRNSYILNNSRPTTAGARSSSQNLPFTFHRSSSAASLHHDPSRTNTSHNFSSNPLAMRSDTRLSTQNNSHQPLSRQNTDSSRREALMADWRISQQQSQTAAAARVVEERRAQVILERDADRFRREKEKSQRARMDAAFDQSMRTQPGIDAHREVLRRMQSKANEKIK